MKHGLYTLPYFLHFIEEQILHEHNRHTKNSKERDIHTHMEISI